MSVGGEIGEVGKQNSTPDELIAYLDGYSRELAARAPGATGLSKVSVQTGTSHGGVPLPGGGVAEVKLDFEVLRELGEIARSRGLAGAVQHGASTLPDELFHHFPAVETAEIHLATGFQNALYDHPAFPSSLMDEILAWCADQRGRRAQGRPDRRAVPVHDAQEGDRPVQAPAVGAGDPGRDPRGAGHQARVPVHGAAGQRDAWSWSSGTSSRSRSRARSPSRWPSRSPAEPAMTAGPGDPPASDAPRRSRSRSGSRRPATSPGSATSSSPRSAVPRRPRSSTRSGPTRRTAGGRWSRWTAAGRIVGHLLMSPCPVEDDDGGASRDGARDRSGGRGPGRPAARRRERADGLRGEPGRRPGGAGARAPRPSVVLPAVRVRVRPRRRPRAARRRPGPTKPGWPGCCPRGPTTMRGTVRYHEAFEPLA